LPAEASRRDQLMSLSADDGYLIPVDVAVEPDPDPASMAHVRGPEEAVRFGTREFLLGARRRGAPQVRELVVVMPGRPQHDELPADEERRGAVTGAFLDAGQRQADTADPVLDRRGISLSRVRAHGDDLKSIRPTAVTAPMVRLVARLAPTRRGEFSRSAVMAP